MLLSVYVLRVITLFSRECWSADFPNYPQIQRVTTELIAFSCELSLYPNCNLKQSGNLANQRIHVVIEIIVRSRVSPERDVENYCSVIYAVSHSYNPKSACNVLGIVCIVSPCYTLWCIVSSLTSSDNLNQDLNNYINIKYVSIHILKSTVVWLWRWRYRIWVFDCITHGTVDVITYIYPSLGWYLSVKGTMVLFATWYLICKLAIFTA